MFKYQREISRTHKLLLVFLLDQSLSMEARLGGRNANGRRKMDELARAINKWIETMSIRSTGSEAVKHWMDMALIGYRTDQEGRPILESPLDGAIGEKARRENRFLFSIVELAKHPARIAQLPMSFYDEESGEIMQTPQDVPVWVEPRAEGGRPMCSALRLACDIVEQWIAISQNKDSFPPIMVHVTGGNSQDGDPIPYAEAIRGLSTGDGCVLLYNTYLSSTPIDPVLFPSEASPEWDDAARTLFRMSSPLPERLIAGLVSEGFELKNSSRLLSPESVSFDGEYLG